MSELNFKNFPSLSKGVATSANENLTTAEKNQLNKYLQEISETAGKLSECHTIMGFMRETGQLANSYSIQSQMTALASSFGEKKKKILAMLGSDKVSSTSEEQIKKHPSIAKLRSFFDKNIALQTKPSSQNKEAVSQMKKNFDDSFYKRLDSISAMLPTQTRELFLSYMKEYMTTIGSSNKSESEKLADSRILDERLAKIGCINLKYLVINDRTWMISDMLSNSFSGDLQQAIQGIYSHSGTNPMNSKNYRTAAGLAETLKISYLESKGLSDEYGEKYLDRFDYVSLTKTIERDIYNPVAEEKVLIDNEAIEEYQVSLRKELNVMFDSIIPENATPTTYKTPIFSENLATSTINSLQLANSLAGLPEATKKALQDYILEQSSQIINEKLQENSNQTDTYSAQIQENALIQTIAHKDINSHYETTSTIDLNDPNKVKLNRNDYESKSITSKDSFGNVVSHEVDTKKQIGTNYEILEEALVFENKPTTIEFIDPTTNQATTITIDSNDLLVNAENLTPFAREVYNNYIKEKIAEMDPDEQEIYMAELFEKEQAQKEALEKEKEQAFPAQSKQSLTPSEPAPQQTPSQEEIWAERNKREAEAENEFVMTRKPNKK